MRRKKECLLGLSCIVGGRPRRRTHLGRILRGRPSFLFFLYGALRTVPSASLARHKMVIVPCRNSSAGPRLCTTGGVSMCDYSLHDVASRPAKVGDKLVSTQFPNAVTRGFCDPGQPRVAVCLLPGTELAFEKEVECDSPVWFLWTRISPHKVARFQQVNLSRPNIHHDALEFPDGKTVLVTDLCEGQH